MESPLSEEKSVLIVEPPRAKGVVEKQVSNAGILLSIAHKLNTYLVNFPHSYVFEPHTSIQTFSLLSTPIALKVLPDSVSAADSSALGARRCHETAMWPRRACYLAKMLHYSYFLSIHQARGGSPPAAVSRPPRMNTST